MKDFAKLFTFKDIGQVLVTLDETESEANIGPDIHISFKPNNLGVCSVILGNFGKTADEAWDAGEDAFGKIDEEFAYKTAKKVIDEYSGLFGGEK